MDFDYKTAWEQLSKPLYEKLPPRIIDLILMVERVAAGLSQGHDLQMPWPEDPTFEKAFAEIPTLELSEAARVVWSFGHWAPERVQLQESGTYWKFSHYADQTIRGRLWNPSAATSEGHFKRPPYEIRVHEGFLRLCISDHHGWRWKEIEPASEYAFGALLAALDRIGDTRDVEAVTSKVPWTASDEMKRFVDLSEFDTSSEAKRLRMLRAPPAPKGWRIEQISSVNYKPHPFTIGTEHFVDGRIDSSVPCAHRGPRRERCNLSLEEHTFDTVAIVSSPETGDVEKVILDDASKEWLKAVADAAETEEFKKLGRALDGFSFIKKE